MAFGGGTSRGPLHGTRTSGFRPSALFGGGLKGVWYDPSDLSTVWQDSARTTPGAVNSPVGCIDDKSGNGANATQATAGSRPILRQAGSLFYLEFDGVDDFLATAAINFSARDEVSVFAGVRKTSDVANQVIVENTTGAGSFRLYVPAAGTGYTHGMTGSLSSDSTATGFAAPATSVVTGLGKISTDQNIIRVNGAQRASAATDQGTGNMGNFILYIGRRDGTSLPFAGNLYGLLVVGALVADPLRTENWLNGKTGAF